VAGQALFTASWIIGALAQPGYSGADQTVSELFSRTAAHPWIVQVGIAALVPSYLAAGVLARRVSGSLVAPLLFAVAAPLALTVLVSPLDCMTNGDARCAAKAIAGHVSAAHRLHNHAAVALQLCLSATPFATAWALRRRRLPAVPALGWGLVGVAAIVAYVIADPGDHGYGWAQRSMFLAVAFWVVALARISVAADGSRDLHSGFASRSRKREPPT
jgi:hypothetical protein